MAKRGGKRDCSLCVLQLMPVNGKELFVIMRIESKQNDAEVDFQFDSVHVEIIFKTNSTSL